MFVRVFWICLGFNEAVIMERDYYFKEIDNELMNFNPHDKMNKISGMLQSFSNQ